MKMYENLITPIEILKKTIIDRDKPYALQGYSFDQRLENVDIDFNVPHTPIVGLGQKVATVSATSRGNSPNLSQPNQ